MHPNQIVFFNQLKKKYPQCFKNIKVLDVGALDINGNNRHLFKNCDYTGLDVVSGANVDVVCPCHEYKEEDESFDVVISTNALEHDMYISKTLGKMYDLLKPCGYMFISAASSWAKHGTKTTGINLSGTATIEKDGWCDYYKNVTPDMLRKHLKLKVNKGKKSKLFELYEIETSRRDIRFIGQKRGEGC